MQLAKEKGGVALANLKDYYYATQLAPVIKLGDTAYNAKWKDIEMTVADTPVQSLIGNIKLKTAIEQATDSISSHTLNVLFLTLSNRTNYKKK